MIVTKDFLKGLKTANSFILRIDGKYSLLELNFQEFDKEKGYHVDSHRTTYEIDMSRRAGLSNGKYGELKGFWMLSLYNSVVTHEGSIFGTLRDKDEISFTVINMGNEYTRKTGINVLSLKMSVVRRTARQDKRFQFILDTQTCPTNSACHLESGVELLPYPDLPELSQYA